MRENRPSGSEGGGPERKAGLPTPMTRVSCLDWMKWLASIATRLR